MIHQRRFAGLDILGTHDALASLSMSGAVGAGCGAASGWTTRAIASGSIAAAWASASENVSGIGASGVVGITSGSIACGSVGAAAGVSLDVAAASLDIAGASLDVAGLSMSSIRSALPTSFSSEVMTLPLAKP